METADIVISGSVPSITDGGGPRAGQGTPINRPDPTREYVSGGDGYTAQTLPRVLPTTIDELTRMLGWRAYDAMQTHPAVHASILTLKLGIMAGDLQLVETHPLEPGETEETPEQKLSAEVKAFCQRLTDRVTDFRSRILRLLDCVADGNKIAEIVARVAVDGEDKGRLILDRLSVKSRRSWDFVVDQHLNVKGFRFKDGSGYKILPPEKFVRFTWLPRDNDPRGRSILRAAYSAWNMAIQLYPQYYKYLKQFGAPSLVGTTAPLAKNETVGGKTYTAQEYMLLQMEEFHNGSAIAIPFGATITPIAPSNAASSPFLDAFNHLNQEMTFAILMQSRATREAQHGSKADNEGGLDILGLLFGYGRDMASESLRDNLYKLFVAVNYGQEIADVYTPYVYLGAVDPKDVVARWNALANCYRAGAVTDSVKAEWHAKAEAPIPDIEADRRAAESAQKAAMDLAKAASGPNEGENEDGSRKPPDASEG